MRGFIAIKNAPTEHDDNTYFVNIGAIVFFHAIDHGTIEELHQDTKTLGTAAYDFPKTFVFVNASDFDGSQLMFRITDTPEMFAARLETAMAT